MRVELRVRCLTRRASPEVIGAVCVAAVAGAPPALAAPRVLRVGTYHRIPGQFRTIQAAVDHARRGDGVLVAAGDYHERADHRHPPGVRSAVPPSGVLSRTPGLSMSGAIQRIRRRQFQATCDEPDAVASVNGGLQAPERGLLLGLELTQALIGVQCAAERHGELVAIGLPALGGHQEPGGIGVAATDRAIQTTSAERVASDEHSPSS